MNELPRKLYGVFGSPISHSLSPQIQHAAFAHYGLPARYLRLQARSAGEMKFLADLLNLSGWNITAPLKEEAFQLPVQASNDAAETGAINTVVRVPSGLLAENTDIQGVTDSLAEAGFLEGSAALVLGAGGGGRAALKALKGRATEIYLANRSAEKADALAREFGAVTVPYHAEGLLALRDKVSLIISTIDSPDIPLRENFFRPSHIFFDAIYKRESALHEAVIRTGAKLIRGERWLLHQGARAFELFTERTAPLTAMETALRSSSVHRPLAFIGLPGSGKTTTTDLLSRMTGEKAIELDSLIEARAGCSITELFKERGEAAFREKELAALSEALQSRVPIISCGGGVVTSESARRLLKESAFCVWLVSSLERLETRLKDSKDSRPLLAGGPLPLRLRTLWENRIMQYADCADYVLSTEHASPEETAQSLIKEFFTAERT